MKCGGQFHANGWSGRMQLDGRVCAIPQPRKGELAERLRYTLVLRSLMLESEASKGSAAFFAT